MIDFIKKLFSQDRKEKDPVCAMMVDAKKTSYRSTYQEKHYYFCSEDCKKQFEENPKQFISS